MDKNARKPALKADHFAESRSRVITVQQHQGAIPLNQIKNGHRCRQRKNGIIKAMNIELQWFHQYHSLMAENL